MRYQQIIFLWPRLYAFEKKANFEHGCRIAEISFFYPNQSMHLGLVLPTLKKWRN